MATGTSFNPQNKSEYEKSKLKKYAKGYEFNPTLGAETNFDIDLTDDVLMAGGGCFLAANVKQGDKVHFEVLAPVGPGGSYVTVDRFVEDWFLNPEQVHQSVPESNYPAKLTAGLKLRLIYVSVGVSGTDPQPWCAMNFDLEKVLV